MASPNVMCTWTSRARWALGRIGLPNRSGVFMAHATLALYGKTVTETALRQLDLSALEQTLGPTTIVSNGGLKIEGSKLGLTVEIKIPTFPPNQL